MKVGSIVECISNSNCYFLANGKQIFAIKPALKQPYTVREIRNLKTDSSTSILLEEIINNPHPTLHVEPAYNIKMFRELLPPMEIQDALDSCEPILIELNK